MTIKQFTTHWKTLLENKEWKLNRSAIETRIQNQENTYCPITAVCDFLVKGDYPMWKTSVAAKKLRISKDRHKIIMLADLNPPDAFTRKLEQLSTQTKIKS